MTPILTREEIDARTARLQRIWARLPKFSVLKAYNKEPYIHRMDLHVQRFYSDVRLIEAPHFCWLVWAGEWLVMQANDPDFEQLRMYDPAAWADTEVGCG